MSEWDRETLTKHDQILKYIENLKIGSKISVRKTARDLEVSEGTAYRAIKEAESNGLVATRERIGTIRIEKKQRMEVHRLTFGDVVNIVDGEVLGGEQGLGKPLNKFVIGAMEQDAMKRYIEAGSLLIVGNRFEAHMLALEFGAGVLVTGGFHTTPEAKRLANQLGIPIISSRDDTYTVASMINRALYDSAIKKKIMLVEDIVVPRDEVVFLRSASRIADWQRLLEQTGRSRVPVLDEWNRVIGIVTPKDVVGASPDQTVDKIMTRGPLTCSLKTSIATAAHLMVWEGIELLPVVDDSRKLQGVLSRRDVLRAMQNLQRQPQSGETLEDIIWNGFREERGEDGNLRLSGVVTPQMSSGLGTVSEGVLTTLMTKAGFRIIQEVRKGDLVMENMSTYFVRPLQIDSVIDILPRSIEISRKFGKAEVAVLHQGNLICKSMLTAQFIDQS